MSRILKNVSFIAVLLSATWTASVNAQSPPAAEPAPAPVESPPPGPAATVSRVAIDAPPLQGITAWGMVNWDGFGVGARYMFPLGIPSVLSRTKLRDSWALEGGVDYFRIRNTFGTFGYHYDELLPTVGMMWIVWLNQDFAVYPKIDGGYAFGFNNSYGNCAGCSLGGLRIEGAAGLLYKVGGVTLRAELGNYGVKGGVAWLF